MAYIAKLDYHFAQARYCRLVIVVMDTETRQVVARYSTRIEEEIAPRLDVAIDGNRIMVDTLDLNQEFEAIERQLREIVTKIFADLPYM